MILHTGDSPSPTGMLQYQDTDGDGIADAWVMTGVTYKTNHKAMDFLYRFCPIKNWDGTRKKFVMLSKINLLMIGLMGRGRGSAYPWVIHFWDRDPRWY